MGLSISNYSHYECFWPLLDVHDSSLQHRRPDNPKLLLVYLPNPKLFKESPTPTILHSFEDQRIQKLHSGLPGNIY